MANPYQSKTRTGLGQIEPVVSTKTATQLPADEKPGHRQCTLRICHAIQEPVSADTTPRKLLPVPPGRTTRSTDFAMPAWSEATGGSVKKKRNAGRRETHGAVQRKSLGCAKSYDMSPFQHSPLCLFKTRCEIQQQSKLLLTSSTMSPQIPASQPFVPVITGGDLGAYTLAREFHEAYGVISAVVPTADNLVVGGSKITQVFPAGPMFEASSVLEHL